MIDPASLYGINQGAAQVLKGNVGLNYLQQQINKEQAQKAKDDAMAQAQLQKLDYNKTKEADQPYFAERYGDIQKAYNQMRNTQDPTQRMLLNSQLQSKQKDFMHAVSLSQQALENEKFLGQHMIANGDKLKDDYGKSFHDLTNTTTFGNDYKNKLTYFDDANAAKYDFATFEKTKLIPNSLTRVGNFGKEVTEKSPTGTSVYRIEGNDLNPDAVKQSVTKEVLANKPMAKALLAQYPGADLQTAINSYSQQVYDTNKDKYGEVKKSVGHQFPAAPDKFYQHYNYELAHPKPNSLAGTQLLPTQEFGAKMMNGDIGTGKQFLNYAPKSQFRPHEAPTIEEKNGYHVITVPDQVIKDEQAVKANAEAKKDYMSKPEKKGSILGFGGKEIPYEQSDEYKTNPPLDEFKLVTNGTGQQYVLDPKNPVDYNSQLAEISRKLKIPTSEINKQVGGKGSRGVNTAIEQKLHNPVNKNKIKGTNQKLY